MSEDWGNDFFDTIEKEKQEQKKKLEPPKKYHVYILNDDFSTFELVIAICSKFFGQTAEQANRTAIDVHTKGKGLAGTYTKDIAETKSVIANEFSQANESPLLTKVEAE